ncbi:hypothetical protein V6N11_061657 [Hibiscus sabdariffa]|uniref:Strawberry notch AAA domain-containing protein n=1 Tax=Hibiscus sabdariffa TaxID=183260 RepID=A0ABR1ZSR0_9ROSI
MPSGARAGFFVGDGAGVVKGLNNCRVNMEEPTPYKEESTVSFRLISVGSYLKFDARRDLDDVGAACIEVHALNKAALNKLPCSKLPCSKLDLKFVGINQGVVFLTYSSLIGIMRNDVFVCSSL